MLRLALVLAYFVHVGPGQRQATSTVHLQSFPIGDSNEPSKAVGGASHMQLVDQAHGSVKGVRDKDPIDLISRLATLQKNQLANSNSRVAPTESERIWWQKRLLKMQEDHSSLTAPQLKYTLKEKALKASGKKAELIERLEEQASQEEVPMLVPLANADTTEGAYVSPKSADDAKLIPKSQEQDPNNLEDLSVAQLKDMLKTNGLKVSGKKPELIGRLKGHMAKMMARKRVPTLASPASGKTADDADVSAKSWLNAKLDKFRAERDLPTSTPPASGKTADDANVPPNSWLMARLDKMMAEGKILAPRASGKTAEDAADLDEAAEEDAAEEESDLEDSDAADLDEAAEEDAAEEEGDLEDSGMEGLDEAAEEDAAKEEDYLEDLGMESLDEAAEEDAAEEKDDFGMEDFDEAAEEDAADEEVPSTCTAPIRSVETAGDANMFPKTRETQLKQQKVAQLKEMLAEKGLKVSGLKTAA